MADFTDLDWAFTCPESVTDDDLRCGYEILVARFRVEGAHLPLNTAFQLLIERTINAYIKAKQTERRKYNAAGRFRARRPGEGFQRLRAEAAARGQRHAAEESPDC